MVVGGSALVAYALLAASVLLGLVLSLGVLGKSGTKLSDTHEALSVGALLATLVHMTGIAFDGLVDFDPAAILVPGRAPWRPVAVACGVLAFYGMLVIIFSFHIRKHIGQATWRAVHSSPSGCSWPRSSTVSPPAATRPTRRCSPSTWAPRRQCPPWSRCAS